MEQFYSLDDITLIPSDFNQGPVEDNKINYCVEEKIDATVNKSYPIFTSPLAAIIGESNWEFWQRSGIRPIIPITETLEVRLSLCRFVFSAFTIKEAKQVFVDEGARKVGSASQYHVYLDTSNGHNSAIFDLGTKLKQMYNNQILLIGGPISSPKAYEFYSRSGFDFVRVGSNSDALVSRAPSLFNYPMASLLDAIKNFKSRAGVGLHNVKIIADGDIENPIDILKAIALGADYVMIGQDFSRVVEAAGTIYRVSKTGGGDKEKDEIDPNTLTNLPGFKARINGFCRYYYCNTALEKEAYRCGYKSVAEWKRECNKKEYSWEMVDIDTNLEEWIEDYQNHVRTGFMMTNSLNWADYKKNIRYGSII